MEAIINTIKALVEQIETWPSSVLLCMCLTVFAGFLRIMKWFPNKWIPALIFGLGAALNFFIGDVTKVSPSQRYPDVILILWGFFLAAIAYVLSRIALKKFEKQIQILKNGGETQIMERLKIDDDKPKSD